MNVIISGGTCAGKTTIVNHFKKNSYSTIREAGNIIINDLNEKLSIKGQKEFRRNNPNNFYELILNKQIQLENEYIKPTCNRFTFFDRGVLDYIAMYQIETLLSFESLKFIVNRRDYDVVFVLNPFDKFNERKVSGRSLDYQQSLKLSEKCYQLYNKDYDTIFIKNGNIENRIQHIESYLGHNFSD